MHGKSTFIAILLGLSLGACGAASAGPDRPDTAEERAILMEWDGDDDDILTENELLGGFDETTIDWDLDGDAALSPVEMSHGMFALWDTDGDGNLEVDEFERGAHYWLEGAWDYAGFEDWDADGDLELTLAEFDDGFTRLAIHDTLDGDDDAHVTAPELAFGYVMRWDTDGDGQVDREEWRGFE